MKIRTTIAVMAAKITGHVCKLMGRQGVTWAGKDRIEDMSGYPGGAILSGKRKNICSMWNQRKDNNQ